MKHLLSSSPSNPTIHPQQASGTSLVTKLITPGSQFHSRNLDHARSDAIRDCSRPRLLGLLPGARNLTTLRYIETPTMPAAVPSRSGGPSSGRPPATNAPRTHPTRMPAATSSLRVQLPPGEFLDSFGSFGSNAEPRNRSQALVPAAAAQASDDTPAAVAARDARPPNVPPPPQVSDATLLAQGILEQQRKAREILAWQQRLMEDRRISREELKRGVSRRKWMVWVHTFTWIPL